MVNNREGKESTSSFCHLMWPFKLMYVINLIVICWRVSLYLVIASLFLFVFVFIFLCIMRVKDICTL